MTAGLLRAAGEASLSAAVMILAVLILRMKFQDRTPRRAFCLLWDIVLVRLLVLGALPSPVSIRRWLPAAGWLPVIGAQAQSTAVSQPETVTAVITPGMIVQEALQVDTAYLTEDTLQFVTVGTAAQAPAAMDWSVVLTALWLGAALLLAGGFLWSHLRSREVYASSLPCRDAFVLDWLADHCLYRPVQARVSDQITAPLTYGVLYPVILLPREMDWEDPAVLSCVLSHEHTHIRRFDALRKVFLAAALCLHWFDPLVWVMYALANRDIELACDEAVLRGGADRERYALALLSMEERRGRWSPSGSHFSGHALEERIKAIMKRKHISMTALIAVMVVMSITTTVFASAAPEGMEDSTPGQDQNTPVTAAYVETEKTSDVVIMSNGETGEKFYSVDSGETWMIEERYHVEYGSWGDDWQVEWWTYEDYKAWLEEEKAALQSIIGERGYTNSTGWFTWDQARVDETIALYESILEEIKNGALYSKTIINKDGSEVKDVALGSCGGNVLQMSDSSFDSIIPEAAFNICDKNTMYAQQNIVVPANDTLYLPVQIITEEDDSYLVLSIYCDEEITFGVTDRDQFIRSAMISGEHLREWFDLGSAGTYYALLTNEMDHDITVSHLHMTNSEWELHDGTVADAERHSTIHWIDSYSNPYNI